jgi:hypothetical protein
MPPRSPSPLLTACAAAWLARPQRSRHSSPQRLQQQVEKQFRLCNWLQLLRKAHTYVCLHRRWPGTHTSCCRVCCLNTCRACAVWRHSCHNVATMLHAYMIGRHAAVSLGCYRAG